MTDFADVEVGGVRLRTAIDGAPGAPWLVLSNSLGANLSMWDRQMAALTVSFRVLRYDTRGHGGSDVPPGPYDFADFTGDVLGLMDHFGIEKARFMGVSLGGMTGMGLAIHHGARLERLVVADARADAPDGFRSMWDDRIARIRDGGIGAIVEGTLESWISAASRDADPGISDIVRGMVSATDQAGYIATCEGLKQLDYFRDLHRIMIPTLFVGGSEDRGAAPEVMGEMASRTPGGRYVSIDGACHLANLDMPDAFNEAVVDFLSG